MADLQESRVRENRERSHPLQLSSPDAVPTLHSQIKDPCWTRSSLFYFCEGGGEAMHFCLLFFYVQKFHPSVSIVLHCL